MLEGEDIITCSNGKYRRQYRSVGAAADPRAPAKGGSLTMMRLPDRSLTRHGGFMMIPSYIEEKARAAIGPYWYAWMRASNGFLPQYGQKKLTPGFKHYSPNELIYAGRATEVLALLQQIQRAGQE